ncbi:MAG: iron-hydroxamate transporter ATP-binding subunit, partial [Rhizobiales bacterium 32-66-8]
VEAAIGLTDTGAFADRLVDTLSGGERQRVWVAMLVAQDAGCLLLDEPTSALDIAHQIEVLTLIRSLCRTRGTGVVIVLHDVNMAARFCDDILALQGGHLIARGTPAEIVTPETLERIYGIPMDVMRHAPSGDYVAVPRA